MQSHSDFSIIKTVLDKYFNFMREIEGNSYITELIPDSMIDETKENGGEGWSYWKPLPSAVTEKEIAQLESYFKHKLPESYKFFLHQKHFIELYFGQYSIRFFSNLPAELVPHFEETIKELYWNLPKRNYIPFAHLSDYGVLCFDANKKVTDNDYPVVEFNHEDGYHQPELYSKNFLEMFPEFNGHLDDWIKNNREIRSGNTPA